MRRFLSILLLSLTLAATLPEQLWAEPRRNSATVRRERRRAEREQEATRRRIEENTARIERELRHLERLEADIEANERRERILSRRVDSTAARVRVLGDSVATLTARVERLDRSYSNSLRAIRRQRQAASPAAFVFSSETFGQAVRRIRYLADLADWNATQGQRLRQERARLEESAARLDSSRTRLATSRNRLRRARASMEADRRSASQLVENLRNNAGELNRVLERQRQQAIALDDELNRAIEAEEAERRAAEEAARRAEAERRAAKEAARRAAEEARRADSAAAGHRQSGPTQPAPEQTAAQAQPSRPPRQERPARQTRSAAELTREFESSRGRLPMPVDGDATIVSNFGRRAHTEYSRVELQNNGIDIEARPGAKARVVADGTVSMIIVMDGFRNVVLVRHGEYLTVYAGLDTLDVRKGDNVSAGQSLGTIHTADGDHGTRLHFEVRHEKEKLDPRQWLR